MTFKNLDVLSLLSKMERLHSEIPTLRHVVKLQADIGENLRSVTATIGSRVDAVERQLEPSNGGGLAILVGEKTKELAKKRANGSFPGSSADPSCVRAPASPRTKLTLSDVRVCAKAGEGSGTTSVCPSPGGIADNLPKWSRVVKKGWAQSNHVEGQIALRAGKLIGGDLSLLVLVLKGVRVIGTKLVSVFATKFSPDLDAKTLSEYLSGPLGCSVNCQHIVTGGKSYSLFKCLQSAMKLRKCTIQNSGQKALL